MRRECDSGDGVGGKKDVIEADIAPGVPGVEGRLCAKERVGGVDGCGVR